MWIVYLTVAIGFLFAIVTRERSRRATNGLPEGPRGYPLLGCYTFLKTYPERTLHRWAQKYGSLYSFMVGNQRFVVASDLDIAKDLFLSKRSICSDRKETFVKSQTILKGRGITSTSYGAIWRRHRKIAVISLERQDVNQHIGVLDSQTTKMIRALYKASADGEHVNPEAHINRCSLDCMRAITFGSLGIPATDSQVLDLSRKFMTMTGPMTNLVDFLPSWLQRNVPWETKRRGKELHATLVDIYGRQVKRIQHDIENDVHVENCLVKTMITRRERDQLDDLDMTMLASAFMLDGRNNTSHPRVRQRDHEELDRVVGRSRPPNLGDEASLPYCRAIVKELERCHNPFWLGVPHAVSQDLVYNDKRIPAGSALILNTWTMHHDPARWSNPLEFNVIHPCSRKNIMPDRYLNDGLSSIESARLANPRMRDHWTFGVGRRICPGILVAQREIWLAVAKMLWAFDMAEVPGEPIDLSKYNDVSGRSPIPFKILLRPRFKKVDEVVAKAEATADWAA
ncbi:hypothetical protein COCSADRAFT_27267 [Bipolaris sorokiniana ND90Pr]|uniref:Cytochrome P450 n=1 Tax=Cochliobolus sativus (strain ND90Pr / ATCC 201652) TaxID=665912 RepID=M2T0M8_COCSN|nr:uncharacterized protein COCSADRAFT_27267 [Bipolaris sorokiniana ND90Pr]EMD62766.1 hypothetical protein COCSADRAFT_27267 [Bipolaris sorokiniana ND90Pr]